jgi:hypothetical protein
MDNASRSNESDRGRVAPGKPIPRPTSRTGWLTIGLDLMTQLRQQLGVQKEQQTLAVGWTDAPGLEAERFLGASRAIRDRAHLPAPSQHIVTPRSNAQFQDHAEQDVINGFIDGVHRKGIDLSKEEATLWIFVSHLKGPCTACIQGFGKERLVEPGVLLQLSKQFPSLLISLGWQTHGEQLGHISILAGDRL